MCSGSSNSLSIRSIHEHFVPLTESTNHAMKCVVHLFKKASVLEICCRVLTFVSTACNRVVGP
jgi:hypothetical protein